MLKIFAVQNRRARRPSRLYDQGIPKGYMDKPVELDCGNHIVSIKANDSTASQDLDFPLGCFGSHPELAG